jgi:hypothetical protein
MSREQAAFRSGKTPIMAKYISDHSALMTEIAARGFVFMPGYAYDAENLLELAAKINLSELSFKILSETIDRETKQAGIDYDMAYKSAAVAWEIEKQALMAAWDAELAGLKQGQAVQEEVLNLLAIEVSKRAITLSEAKNALDLQMEGYRKTLAELDGTVAPYEVQLANAKLLTAQKKLELLPIFTEILAKEQELLVLEQSKAAEYTEYMAAENEVMLKKQALTPFINTLATKVEELATKITTDQIPKEESIAAEKVAQSEAAVTKSGYHVREIEADVETETKRLELLGNKRELDTAQFNYEQSIVSHEIDLTSEQQNEIRSTFDDMQAAERQNATSILSDKRTAETIRNTTKLTSTNTLANGEIDHDDRVTSYRIDEMEQVADAQAAARLTASLTHLIG